MKVDKRHYRKIAQENWGLSDEQMVGMHVHHRIPLSQGGSNDRTNLYVCSPSFHAVVWHGVPNLLSLIKNSSENARKGGAAHKGMRRSPEMRTRISTTLTGRKDNEKTKARKRAAHLGKSLSKSHSDAISTARKKTKRVACPHCGTTGQPHTMARWHFDKCKSK